jgi:hypothetical protein
MNSFVEKANKTYTAEFKNTEIKLKAIRGKLDDIFGYGNPIDRVVIDDRIKLLDNQFQKFAYEINPHHLQPGLLLDVDLTTSKRKQYMMKTLANVLNEFLYGVSQGFADAAFASFKRRRSTVRSESEMAFEGDDAGGKHSLTPYDDAEEEAVSRGEQPSASRVMPAPAPTSGGPLGSADVTPKSMQDKMREMGLSEI